MTKMACFLKIGGTQKKGDGKAVQGRYHCASPGEPGHSQIHPPDLVGGGLVHCASVGICVEAQTGVAVRLLIKRAPCNTDSGRTTHGSFVWGQHLPKRLYFDKRRGSPEAV